MFDNAIEFGYMYPEVVSCRAFKFNPDLKFVFDDMGIIKITD